MTPHNTNTTTSPTRQADPIMNQIRIRSYRASDHEDVVALFVAGVADYAKLPGQSPAFWDKLIAMSVQGDLADIENAYFATGGHFWVAVVDKEQGGAEEIVGTVALQRNSENSNEGELRRMSVQAEYRRYGLGRKLVGHLEAWALEQHITRVVLHVGYVVDAVHTFYKSLGFAIFGERVLSQDPLFIEACFEKSLVAVGTTNSTAALS